MYASRPQHYTGVGHIPGPPPLPQEYIGEPSATDSAGHKFSLMAGAANRTQYPVVTGTSVFGIKYKDGILMAADTLASYGSTKRYKSVDRIKAVGKGTAIGATGEMSDFNFIMTMLDERLTTDFALDDGNSMAPWEIHSYLNRVLYNRRNKFDPLWNSLVIGGVKNGRSYLGTVDKIGVHYTDSHVATGFGNHLARPIFRNEQRDDMSLEEGIQLLEKCLRVCYYRDKNMINKFQIANITEGKVEISEPYALTTKWDYKFFENPTKGAEGSW